MRPEIEIVADHLRRLSQHFGPSLPGPLRAHSVECRQDFPDDPIYLISEDALLDRFRRILRVIEQVSGDANRTAAALLLSEMPYQEIVGGVYGGNIACLDAFAEQLAQTLEDAGLTTPLEYLLDH